MIIKSFKVFYSNLRINEELETETTDQKVQKEESKKELDSLQKQLSEFNSKFKSKIEQLYSTTENDVEISQEIENLMPEEKNKFAVDWMRVCRLEKEIRGLVNKRDSKKDKKEELIDRKELNKNDPQSLQNLEVKIKQNEDDSKTIITTLAEKEKELKQAQNDHQKLMDEAKQELEDIKKEI
jgi:hypothetical protein